MPRCCVRGCKNNGLHVFPADSKIRRKWIAAVRIKNCKLKVSTRLCHDHFHADDYKTICVVTGLPYAKKLLKKGAVPSIFPWNNKKLSDSALSRKERYKKRSFQSSSVALHCTSQDAASQDFQCSTQQYDYQSEVKVKSTVDCDTVTLSDLGTKITIGTQTLTVLPFFTTDTLLSDDESVNFYTGLESRETFKLAFSSLLPMAHDLKYRSKESEMSTEDQFLLMLIKLRRNKPDFELAKMFGISKSQVSNIFITWINFVSDLWSIMDIWPSRDIVNFYMPKEFKDSRMPIHSVMADHGFYTKDLLASKNIGIIIPKILKGKAPLPGLALMHDTKIEIKRVHIKILIGLTKIFKVLDILKRELKTYYVHLASKIFFICVVLCNFRENSINKSH